MIRYKRLNESFDITKMSATQIMRTPESSEFIKKLKEVTNIKDVENLIEDVLDVLYSVCEEADVTPVLSSNRWANNYGGLSDYFLFGFVLSFQVIVNDDGHVLKKPRKLIRNIQQKVIKNVGDEGGFPGDMCDWEVAFSEDAGFSVTFWFINTLWKKK